VRASSVRCQYLKRNEQTVQQILVGGATVEQVRVEVSSPHLLKRFDETAADEMVPHHRPRLRRPSETVARRV